MTTPYTGRVFGGELSERGGDSDMHRILSVGYNVGTLGVGGAREDRRMDKEDKQRK